MYEIHLEVWIYYDVLIVYVCRKGIIYKFPDCSWYIRLFHLDVEILSWLYEASLLRVFLTIHAPFCDKHTENGRKQYHPSLYHNLFRISVEFKRRGGQLSCDLLLTRCWAGRKGFPCFKLTRENCMGKNKARTHPKIRSETLQYLRDIFKPILVEFNTKTGMNIRLSWSWF